VKEKQQKTKDRYLSVESKTASGKIASSGCSRNNSNVVDGNHSVPHRPRIQPEDPVHSRSNSPVDDWYHPRSNSSPHDRNQRRLNSSHHDRSHRSNSPAHDSFYRSSPTQVCSPAPDSNIMANPDSNRNQITSWGRSHLQLDESTRGVSLGQNEPLT